ncbi:MAG: hypothetical protein HQ526_05170, partial [Actinobacteria bacterium]|nr:hypothetical protein [Actinomycetota bacterium]
MWNPHVMLSLMQCQIVLLLVLCAPVLAFADGQEPELLGDLDVTQAAVSSYPSGFIPFDGRVFFWATTHSTGLEPWSFDPATGAVSLVADLAPGIAYSLYPEFAVVAGRLWMGTSAGLYTLDQADGVPTLFESGSVMQLVAAESLGLLVFVK